MACECFGFAACTQAYCMAKVQPLPMDVHCDIHDVVGALRPKLKWPSSLEVSGCPFPITLL
eukprot:scaffold61778_cov26-Tisochrysis_lutea.AAC.1